MRLDKSRQQRIIALTVVAFVLLAILIVQIGLSCKVRDHFLTISFFTA